MWPLNGCGSYKVTAIYLANAHLAIVLGKRGEPHPALEQRFGRREVSYSLRRIARVRPVAPWAAEGQGLAAVELHRIKTALSTTPPMQQQVS